MKQMTINKDSWHYKLATKFGGLNSYKHTDFCSYMRRVSLGFLALFGICLGFAFVAYLISSGSFFIYLRVTTGHWPKDGWYAPGCILDVIILGACVIIGIIAGVAILFDKRAKRMEEMLQKRRQADYAYYQEYGSYPVREPETHFIRDAYRAFKEKTCYRINVQ
jgi:hypothetical protein